MKKIIAYQATQQMTIAEYAAHMGKTYPATRAAIERRSKWTSNVLKIDQIHRVIILTVKMDQQKKRSRKSKSAPLITTKN